MKKTSEIILYILLIFTLAFTPLVAAKKTLSEDESPLKPTLYDRILTLWHVETFEGGVGSRGDFLTKRAVEFGSDGCHVLVKKHTAESAEIALSQGERPDLVSFGAGADFVVPLVRSFTVRINGERKTAYAFPWAQGGYFLFRKSGDDSPIKTLTVSDGGLNLPLGAAYASGITADIIEVVKSVDAYIKLVSGKTDALIGTQRDIRRFSVREFAYSVTPLETFDDLYQYIAVTADDPDDFAAAEKFAEYLLSDTTGEKLGGLNMFSPFAGTERNYPLSEFDEKKTTKTINPLISAENLIDIKRDLYESVTQRKKCFSFENSTITPSNACN